jgi:CheY-like chemotaxis protein
MKPLAFVIEDMEDVALVFHTAMEKAGFESETIYDGAQALERLARVVPALIVLDLHLPGASGEQILEYIRSDSRFEATKIIVATADVNWADKLTDRSIYIILKPIGFTQLRDMAERLRPFVE